MVTNTSDNSRLVFSAPLQEGSIEICISGSPDQYRDAVSATLELSRHESVIRSLEDWLDQGLGFTFSPFKHIAPPLFSMVTREEQPRVIEVSLPTLTWAYKQGNIPVFNDDISDLYWATHYATLELSAVSLTVNERQRLQQNALLLLPDSFTSEWTVDLVIPALKYRQSGLLVKRPFFWQGLLAFPPMDTNPDLQDEPTAAEQVGCYFEVSTELLLAAGHDLNTYVNNKLSDTSCVINTAENNKYTGQMIPVGDGFGMRIEQALI